MAEMPAAWRRARGCLIIKVKILGDVVKPNGRVLKKKSRLSEEMARNLWRFCLTGTWRKASFMSREAIQDGRSRILLRECWLVMAKDGEEIVSFR